MDESDTQVLDDIEGLWSELDGIDIDMSRVQVLPGSHFAGDQAVMPHFPISNECLELIVCALDHIKGLRQQSGNKPKGFGVWRSKAPWPLLRSALECASQSIWMASPDDQKTRIERVLQMQYDDLKYRIKAQQLVATDEERENVPALNYKQVFDRLAEPWDADEKTARRIRGGVQLSGCVLEAAKSSEIVSNPAVALGYWQMASGYAHGRGWVTEYTATLYHLGNVEGPQQGYKLDYKQIAIMMILVINTIKYAIWLVQQRSGYDGEYEQVAEIRIGSA